MMRRILAAVAGLSVALGMAAGPGVFRAAGNQPYLPAVGPVPLRFQSPPSPPPVLPPTSATPAAPLAVTPAALPPAPATPPVETKAVAVALPDWLKNFPFTPLWAALGEALLASPNSSASLDPAASADAVPAAPPSVTTEMLVEYFRAAGNPGEAATNSAAAPTRPLVAPAFVLPSSSATYRVQ